MGSSDITSKPNVNRWAIGVTVALGTAIALAPATIILDQSRWLPLFVTLAALTSAITLVKFSTSATEVPGALEFLLAGVGALFPLAMSGLLWLAVVALGLGLKYAVSYAAHVFDVNLHSSFDTLAHILAIIPPILLVPIFANVSTSELARLLYPNLAGLKSDFYPLITQRRKKLIVATIIFLIVIVVVSALFIAQGGFGRGFCVFLEIYLFVAGVSVWPAGKGTAQLNRQGTAVETVASVFEAAGFQVERFPRTHRAEVDPLLKELDLLAHKGEDYIAIDVKTSADPSQPTDWKAAFGLQTATSALAKSRSLPRRSLKTMLMLVDAGAGKSLKTAARREASAIIRVTSQEISELVQKGSDPSQPQQAVAKWLAMLPVQDRFVSSRPNLKSSPSS